jgi:hypothetical protein
MDNILLISVLVPCLSAGMLALAIFLYLKNFAVTRSGSKVFIFPLKHTTGYKLTAVSLSSPPLSSLAPRAYCGVLFESAAKQSRCRNGFRGESDSINVHVCGWPKSPGSDLRGLSEASLRASWSRSVRGRNIVVFRIRETEKSISRWSGQDNLHQGNLSFQRKSCQQSVVLSKGRAKGRLCADYGKRREERSHAHSGHRSLQRPASAR